MGETRVKKTKKATKVQEPATVSTSLSLEKLDLNEKLRQPTTSKSQKSAVPPDHGKRLSIPDDENLEADPSYITIQDTEQKGLAVFAARKIPAGTLIVAEKPLIRLTQAEEDHDKPSGSKQEEDDSSLTTQFSSLSKPLQKLYLSLFDSEKSDFSRVKSIYYSNCYNLSGPNRPSTSTSPSSTPSPGGSCIGLTASRINHSCVPNVQFSFDEDKNLMLFHTVKAIPRGREVVGTYDSVFEVKAQRQRRQMLYYGFRCDCEACSAANGDDNGGGGFWRRSDERRKGMIEAKKHVHECDKIYDRDGKSGSGSGAGVGVGAGMDPVAALERLEVLLIKEGIVGLPLADIYRSLVKWTERLGDEGKARKYRERELEVCVTCLGRRSERVKGLRGVLERRRRSRSRSRSRSGER